eukprot:9701847-Prorocentrum_lima.AAC.1
MKTSIVRWSRMLEPTNPWSVHQSLLSDPRSRSANFVGVVGNGDSSSEWGGIDESSSSTAIVP